MKEKIERPIASPEDMAGVEALYTEVILDYYRNPRNKGIIKDADAKFKNWNPLCGDEIEIYLKFADKKIANIKFDGHGCAISQASISMLTEYLQGKSAEYVKKMTNDEVLSLLHIKVTPLRTKCALLGFAAIKKAINKMEKNG